MRLKITQNIKEMFEADFSIYDGANQIGTAKVNGSIKSPESIVKINICGEKIKLSRSHSFREKYTYRPYTIQINEVESGNVFQTEKRKSLFSSYGYQKAYVFSKEYYMYPIGFGDDGIKNPIYCFDKQIGLLLKSTEVYNDLHHFELVVDSEDNIIPTLIMGFYIYVKAFFKPGEKASNSRKVLKAVTTEKELLNKYNEEFEQLYG